MGEERTGELVSGPCPVCPVQNSLKVRNMLRVSTLGIMNSDFNTVCTSCEIYYGLNLLWPMSNSDCVVLAVAARTQDQIPTGRILFQHLYRFFPRYCIEAAAQMGGKKRRERKLHK